MKKIKKRTGDIKLQYSNSWRHGVICSDTTEPLQIAINLARSCNSYTFTEASISWQLGYDYSRKI